VSCGQAPFGFSVSATVTVNEHVPTFPAESVAMQFTVVLPTGKGDPDVGLHEMAMLPGQLSVAVGV